MTHSNRLRRNRNNNCIGPPGPLGIHVVPCNEDGRLVVQGIEPGGRVDRDGRLAVGDEIVDINGYALTAVPFAKAQEIFKEALFAKELRLKVVKGVHDAVARANDEAAFKGGAKDGSNKENVNLNVSGSSGVAKHEGLPAGTKVTTAVQANNTRKIGRILKIELRKGPDGLGFTVTSRDNATGEKPPVYVKNVLNKGMKNSGYDFY